MCSPTTETRPCGRGNRRATTLAPMYVKLLWLIPRFRGPGNVYPADVVRQRTILRGIRRELMKCQCERYGGIRGKPHIRPVSGNPLLGPRTQSAPIRRAADTVLMRCCATRVSTVITPVISMMAISAPNRTI
jgi:hypothetical protein